MQAMDKRLPCMAVNIPGLELGVRSIPTNTPATTIVRQETVVAQIILQRPLHLVSSGVSAIKAKVFLVSNHSSLTRWQNTLYIEIANIFFPKSSPSLPWQLGRRQHDRQTTGTLRKQTTLRGILSLSRLWCIPEPRVGFNLGFSYSLAEDASSAILTHLSKPYN